MNRFHAVLEDRGVVLIGGAEARPFLQGLISNDIDRLGDQPAVYAALLTPQGKYLHDFFVVPLGDSIALDCESARAGDLIRRLGLYRLRAKVTIEDASERLRVIALWGDGPAPAADGMTVYPDPRLPALGWRAIAGRADSLAALEAAGFRAADAAAYAAMRTALGVPDGSRDILVDKSFPLEANFEELHGVDFDKGCYVGQENTARQKHRGVVRKRLMRVDIDGPAPAPGTPIMAGEREAGVMGSSVDGIGIAMLRLEFMGAAPLVAGEARVRPVKPDWARF